MRYFTCFGEVLWDIFPNEAKIGGAPLNVALRLHSLNNKVAIISALGDDASGKELKLELENFSISYHIQKNKKFGKKDQGVAEICLIPTKNNIFLIKGLDVIPPLPDGPAQNKVFFLIFSI